MSDSAYLASSRKSLEYLIEGASGDLGSIPQYYLDYFAHIYQDGDISLLPALSKVKDAEDLEPWQLDEVLDVLEKVNPNEWPDLDSINSISAPHLLGQNPVEDNFSERDGWEYVEDNLGTSEKVQKALKGVIESVFGDDVSTIRSKKGKFPSPENNFLQDKDGTFAGTFKFEGHTFEFEIAPTEKGWICTYRVGEDSLDKLEKPNLRKHGEKPKDRGPRRVRNQGWR